jgi:polyisoprenoid-binding protein YceI
MSFRSLVVLSLVLSACAADVGEGRVAATVTEAAEVTEPATPATADAKTLTVDVAQSKLGLIGAKITAQHPIHFNEFTGEVMVDGDAVTGIHFVAQMASVESDDVRLTEHLKGEDFFHIEVFPTSEFASTTVASGSDSEGFTHTVTGNLTIRGETKQVTFPANIEMADGTVKATTEFVINRQDFKVVYPGRADDLIQDSVAMNIEFVAMGA